MMVSFGVTVVMGALPEVAEVPIALLEASITLAEVPEATEVYSDTNISHHPEEA
jgi:hypothetical protein